MKANLVMIIVALSASAYGQSLTLSGKVFDHTTKEPLVYASISLKGKSEGTITNIDGTFDFYISIHNKNDTLSISMLGYSAYEKVVGELENIDALEIDLKVKPVVLDAVVIKFTKMSGQEIMIRAFENIEKNFPLKPYTLKAFYREMYEENNKTVFLIDAVVDIRDTGYKAMKTSGTQLREKLYGETIRASSMYFQSIFDIEDVNYLKSCLRQNTVKYRNASLDKFLEGRQYAVDSLIYADDKLLYVISSVKRVNNAKQLHTYYIDAESYAIIKHTKENTPANGLFINEHTWRTQSDTSYRYQIKKRAFMHEFGYYNGRLYLKYTKGEIVGDLYNRRENRVEYNMKTNLMLVVTAIDTDKKNKLKNESKVREDRNLGQYVYAYDPGFWGDYDQTKLFPLTKKQIKDMEREMPLEEQFQKQGAKNTVAQKQASE